MLRSLLLTVVRTRMAAPAPRLVTRRSTRLVTVPPTTSVSIPTPVPTATASKRKRTIDDSVSSLSMPSNSDSELSSLSDEEPKPKARRPKKSKRKPSGLEDEEFSPKKSKSKKTKTKAVNGEESAEPSPKKARKPRAPKPEPVYIIPDVERKETTFKGRLGYACLNTILRNKKPAEESIFCSRTCRIDTITKNGMDWVKDLGRKNTADLLKLIEWNVENNIHFMRISSEMFPFASHDKYGYKLDYCAEDLAKVGKLAKKHNHRLTTHPGQYTQLGSPKPNVIASSVRELEYHSEMLNLMGLGADAVMILHGGGTYGDKPAAIERIKHTIANVLSPSVRARLVLENDEDLLPICEELDVPLVFDYHHDNLNPSSIPPKAIIERANAIFARRGIKPKQHLSEPRLGAVTLMERRAHADRCQSLPEDLPDDMDLMIEAKDKEQAVLHLYRIYGLQPVKHESLRPPAEHETKETKGRKSNKRARAKAADEEDQTENATLQDGNNEPDEVIAVTEEKGDGELVAEEEEP